MRKQLFAGLFPPPPLGIRLWLTVIGLVVGGLNLAYLTEIWLHTPAAKTALLAFEWLLLLAVLPQGLWLVGMAMAARLHRAGLATGAGYGHVLEWCLRGLGAVAGRVGRRYWHPVI